MGPTRGGGGGGGGGDGGRRRWPSIDQSPLTDRLFTGRVLATIWPTFIPSLV